MPGRLFVYRSPGKTSRGGGKRGRNRTPRILFPTGLRRSPSRRSDRPLFALARGTSSFMTTEITAHLQTNLDVIERFLHNASRIEGLIGSAGRITIEGIGYGNE